MTPLKSRSTLAVLWDSANAVASWKCFIHLGHVSPCGTPDCLMIWARTFAANSGGVHQSTN